jgi:ABC-2 type transport system ATP-binding protein
MTEPLLELQGVAKHWPAFRLEEAGFALPGGMVMGLVGANGAGKTTLIKIILGLVRPDAGVVRFKGEEVRTAGPALRQRIAYVPDEPRFVAEVRLRTHKETYARFFPDWDEGRWQELMGAFHLDPAATAGSLSLGMRTKFALTLALARNAELLVLDEPTTGLDPVFRRDLLQLLSSLLRDENRSILFSTHITSDLEGRVDLVTLMRDGRVVFTQDQETLAANWVLVKGGLDVLDDEVRAGFRGLRTTPYGFEALAEDGPAARRRFEGLALVERASLEDIIVLMGRRASHAS